jgi:hypothetical protein
MQLSICCRFNHHKDLEETPAVYGGREAKEERKVKGGKVREKMEMEVESGGKLIIRQ